MKIENEEMIVNMGAFGYDARMIASLTDNDPGVVQAELADPKSKLNQLLQKGRDMAQYVLDLKLFDMAKAGYLKAMDKLNVRIQNRNEI